MRRFACLESGKKWGSLSFSFSLGLTPLSFVICESCFSEFSTTRCTQFALWFVLHFPCQLRKLAHLASSLYSLFTSYWLPELKHAFETAVERKWRTWANVLLNSLLSRSNSDYLSFFTGKFTEPPDSNVVYMSVLYHTWNTSDNVCPYVLPLERALQNRADDIMCSCRCAVPAYFKCILPLLPQLNTLTRVLVLWPGAGLGGCSFYSNTPTHFFSQKTGVHRGRADVCAVDSDVLLSSVLHLFFSSSFFLALFSAVGLHLSSRQTGRHTGGHNPLAGFLFCVPRLFFESGRP